MALTSETGRYAQPKISFSCTCGKKYRVAASKAGKKVRCKGCRVKVTVPGDRQISMRSRKAILAELGIDAEAAERAYEAEKESGYRCTVCDAKLADDELKDAYGEAGLTCSDCRAAQIAERGADYKDGERKDKKKDKKLDKWTTSRSAEEVRKKALGYAALFFAGTAGLASSVFGLGALGTVGLASVVAYIGYRTVFKAEYVAEVED